MSMTFRTKQLLAEALGDVAAAGEVSTLVAAATGGVGTDPSVATLVTSGNVTIGGTTTASGHILLASGKVLKVNNTQVVGAQQTAVTPVAVTFSANTPATYGSPTGALTISDGATPTVVELVKYCNELRKNIVDLQAVLHTHGLTT